tara:strand:- start:768 stop:872 length:105 start_codon:yes stop_codon:yes gene_type:complete
LVAGAAFQDKATDGDVEIELFPASAHGDYTAGQK